MALTSLASVSFKTIKAFASSLKRVDTEVKSVREHRGGNVIVAGLPFFDYSYQGLSILRWHAPY